jgi:alkylated DNA repair dioxygenase AlkB
LIEKAIKLDIFEESDPPNQALINRYNRRDRLGLHVEDTAAFGAIIAGISLGSTDYLRLVDASNKDNAHLFELKDCSCYVLAG